MKNKFIWGQNCGQKGVPMSRRGENIHKRKDGRWEARILTKQMNHQTKYKSVYARTYTELKNKLKELPDSNIPLLHHSNVFFHEIALQWLSNIRESVKESSYAKYHSTVTKHLIPYFTKMKIIDIDNMVVEKFIQDKYKNGKLNGKGSLSAKSVHDMYCVLIQILKFAEKNHYIQTCNYDVALPKVEECYCNVFSKSEKIKLEQYVRLNTDLKKLGILLVMYTGIRIGELCALKWSDIDINNGTLRITKTLQRIKNTDTGSEHKTKIIIGKPKSQKSVRSIPLQSFLLEILIPFKQKYSDNAYLLTGSETKFTEPRAYEKTYKKYLKECHIPNIKFHALRHTFATNAVEKNFDTKSLSEILGHSTVRFTLDRYVHPSDKVKRENMERLAANY